MLPQQPLISDDSLRCNHGPGAPGNGIHHAAILGRQFVNVKRNPVFHHPPRWLLFEGGNGIESCLRRWTNRDCELRILAGFFWLSVRSYSSGRSSQLRIGL